jgi:hypothetical protein
MIEISKEEKEKIIQFIKDNELDYTLIDNGIIRFHVMAHDGIKFFFYKYEDQYIITKYDGNKDKEGPGGSNAYQHYPFKTLMQVLEQLSFYDKSLEKCYWQTTSNSIDIGFDQINYIDDWHSEFTTDDKYGLEDGGNYKFITYTNDEYKPELSSPYNTLDEVSPINNKSYTSVDNLHFEIHPISCLQGRESYLLKLQCNNEKVLKEYINYIVSSKKGLKMLLDTIFKDLEPFRSNNI